MSAVSEKRVAIIGAGASGRALARSLKDELTLDAVVDPDLRAARALAGSAAAHASVFELLARRRAPDLALICAPPALHLELATPLLRAGADLLVAPPLATTPDDGELLTELAERLGRVLLCRSALAAGARSAGVARALGRDVGRVARVEIELARERDARGGWRGDPALSGGGVLMHLGPAALELAELLAGRLEQVRLLSADRLQRAEVEDAVQLETAHDDGALASIHLTWNEPGAARARCEGARGELALDVSLDGDAGCAALLRELVGRRGRPDAICDEGARMLGWLHAAYRSRELNRWQWA
jgi:predicted dehydrogenase